MNRLSLAQFVRRKCGISGSETTTAEASGEWLDVVSAVDEAYEILQTERNDWLFLRSTFEFNTVAGKNDYHWYPWPIKKRDFAQWINDEFRIYQGSTNNERHLQQWSSYHSFLNHWQMGSNRDQLGAPTDIVISPDQTLILAVTPIDTSFTVSGHYMMMPDVMVDDEDEPVIPERFHRAIAYKAISLMGAMESAGDLIDLGEINYMDILSKLNDDQLPPITFDRRFI